MTHPRVTPTRRSFLRAATSAALLPAFSSAIGTAQIETPSAPAPWDMTKQFVCLVSPMGFEPMLSP
jgi:hypothetical protein